MWNKVWQLLIGASIGAIVFALLFIEPEFSFGTVYCILIVGGIIGIAIVRCLQD